MSILADDEVATQLWRGTRRGPIKAALRPLVDVPASILIEIQRELRAPALRQKRSRDTVVLPPAPNVFLTPPDRFGPAPPWVEIRQPVSAHAPASAPSRKPRRSLLPLVVLLMIAGIGSGLYFDRHARAEVAIAMKDRLSIVAAHAATFTK